MEENNPQNQHLVSSVLQEDLAPDWSARALGRQSHQIGMKLLYLLE